MEYRIVYAPWLNPIMKRILSGWQAITIGHTIYSGVEVLGSAVIAHEIVHISQWERYGWLFPFKYALSSLEAYRAGTSWYYGNEYEIEARENSR